MGMFNIPKAYINLEAIKVMFTASLSGLKTPTKTHCIVNLEKQVSDPFIQDPTIIATCTFSWTWQTQQKSCAFYNPVKFCEEDFSRNVSCWKLDLLHFSFGFNVSFIGLHLTKRFGQHIYCRCDQKLDPEKRLKLFLKHTKYVVYVFNSVSEQ